jgi:hypothetical protein
VVAGSSVLRRQELDLRRALRFGALLFSEISRAGLAAERMTRDIVFPTVIYE